MTNVAGILARLSMTQSSAFCAGDVVQVRSKGEILATLDERGQLDGLPFMPEMFALCGQRFTVGKRAHKTCDPPNGRAGRRMLNTVHLENVRCDGSAHGGCQARCLSFWKDAWITKVADAAARPPSATTAPPCSEIGVWAAARDTARETGSSGPVFVCQSTQLSAATQPLASWDLRQYVEDCTSGNARPAEIIGSFVAFLAQQVANAGIGLGTAVRFAFDGLQRLRGGTPYPWRTGLIRVGQSTPSTLLQLQPGELVRVKSYEDILETIDENGHNRGLSFDAAMVPYCGGTYQVLARPQHIIDGKSGRVIELQNPCVILDKVVWQGHFARHQLCPRGIYPYWREIWLERVDATAGVAAAPRRPRLVAAPIEDNRRIAGSRA